MQQSDYGLPPALRPGLRGGEGGEHRTRVPEAAELHDDDKSAAAAASSKESVVDSKHRIPPAFLEGYAESAHKAAGEDASKSSKSSVTGSFGANAETGAKPVNRWAQLQRLMAQNNAAALVVAGVICGVPLSGYWLYEKVAAQGEASIENAVREEGGFPEVDFGAPKRITLTQDDVGRILGQRARPAAKPRDEPTLVPFAPPAAKARAVSMGGRSAGATRARAIASPPALEASLPAEMPSPRIISERFYSPGGTISVLQTEAAATGLGLAVGQSIPVALQVGLSSMHMGVVLAQVTQEVRAGERVVLRRGDILKGRASSDGERIYLDFYEVATASKVVRIAGYATEGGLPGVPAQKRKSTIEARSHASVAHGALEVAKSAASAAAATAVGGLPGQVASSVASNVAGQTISEVQRDLRPIEGVVLQLTQGRQFYVVITGD